MLKYMEFTAKTEDEAIAKGLAYLGLDRDDVSVEILDRGKTGFLGIGSGRAAPHPPAGARSPAQARPRPQAGKAQALPPGAPRPQSGAQTPARPQGGQARAQGRA